MFVEYVHSLFSKSEKVLRNLQHFLYIIHSSHIYRNKKNYI